MINATIHRKSFPFYFTDAVCFAKEAASVIVKTMDDRERQKRCTRSAILYSALSLESAANCCLDILRLQKGAHEDFERLRTIAKFQTFLTHVRPRVQIDREHNLVKPIANLISCRDQYVHSKVFCEKIQNGEPKLPIWQPLGLPKNQDYWQPIHAVKVVTVTSDFLNFFFFDLCGFPYMGSNGRGQVASILTSGISALEGERLPGDVPYAPIRENVSWLARGEKDWDLEFAFLGFTATGRDNKQWVPARKWGEYKHCDVNNIEIPTQDYAYDVPSGMGIVSIGKINKKTDSKTNTPNNSEG